MDSEKPVVSEQQIEEFFRSLKRNCGWDPQPGSKLRTSAENYARKHLNDVDDMDYHWRMFCLIALGQ